MARGAQLRDRQPHVQGRNRHPDWSARPRQRELRRRHPAPDDRVHAQPGDDLRAVRRVSQQPRLQRRRLRAGSVDAQPDDAQRRAALRRPARVLRRLYGRSDQVPAEPQPLVSSGGHRQLEGAQSARRCLLRSVRQRQDGDQGEHGSRRRAGIAGDGRRAEPRRQPGDDDGADGDRQQQQPHPRLRPVQLAAQRRVRPVADQHVRQRRTRDAERSRRRFPASACGRGTGSSRPAFNSS